MTPLREALDELPDAVFADFLESDEGYLLILDLPGVTEETVDVTAHTGRLHVEARRSKDVPMDFRYRSEERPVFFEFDLPLPPDVVGSEITASLDRGVLEARLPRSSEGQRIPIEQ